MSHFSAQCFSGGLKQVFIKSLFGKCQFDYAEVSSSVLAKKGLKIVLKKHCIDWRGEFRGDSDLIIFPRSVRQISKILKFCSVTDQSPMTCFCVLQLYYSEIIPKFLLSGIIMVCKHLLR